MSPHDRVRVRHMIGALDAAATFVKGRARDDLDNDRMLLSVIVRAIETFGEAASKESGEARASAPEVPWISVGATMGPAYTMRAPSHGDPSTV